MAASLLDKCFGRILRSMGFRRARAEWMGRTASMPVRNCLCFWTLHNSDAEKSCTTQPGSTGGSGSLPREIWFQPRMERIALVRMVCAQPGAAHFSGSLAARRLDAPALHASRMDSAAGWSLRADGWADVWRCGCSRGLRGVYVRTPADPHGTIFFPINCRSRNAAFSMLHEHRRAGPRSSANSREALRPDRDNQAPPGD